MAVSNENMKWSQKLAVPYLYFPSFEATGLVRHAFSSRHGGISTGSLASLNLDFIDDAGNYFIQENIEVVENMNRFLRSIEVLSPEMVDMPVAHGSKVLYVNQKNRGEGFTGPMTIEAVDGFITDAPGVALSCVCSDSFPLFFLDPAHKAIGLAHVSAQGVCEDLPRKMVESMKDRFGTEPGELLCGIGPGVQACCNEATDEMIANLRGYFSDHFLPFIVQERNDKKYIDLRRAIRLELIGTLVKAENISISEECVYCNEKDFFSAMRQYRVDPTKPWGHQRAVIELK